jgi:hypothetical protein
MRRFAVLVLVVCFCLAVVGFVRDWWHLGPTLVGGVYDHANFSGAD